MFSRVSYCRFGHSLFLAVLVLGSLAGNSVGIKAQGVEPVRVDLGEDGMIPGFSVTVPVFLRVPIDIDVGRIEMDITFANQPISFQHVRRGLISDQINAEITSEVRESPEDPTRSIAEIVITPGEGIPIPSGFLFDLVFLIGRDVPMDSPPIVLENYPRAYSVSQPSELLPNVEGDNGLVRPTSEAPPVASCFFYMH